MANLMRVRASLTGAAVVGPSVSTFYGDAAQVGFPAAVRAFYDAIKGALPNALTITVDSTGDIIESTTGALVGTWTESAGAAVVGTSTEGWVPGVGCRARWNTAGIFNGRRVRGTTFIVPLAKDQFENANNITAGALATIVTAGNTLSSAASDAMRIWSRPTVGGNGQANPVTGCFAPDFVSWLRTRRT